MPSLWSADIAAAARVVIVGASAAGLATATSLRRFGFEGVVRLIERETGPVTERPPLSKEILAGAPDSAASSAQWDRLASQGIELVASADAVHLDLARREVVLADGAREGFDHLVIASGVRPRHLEGGESAGVHTLRNLPDAVRLRAELASSRELLVVGGGLLGFEIAAVATELGASVRLVRSGPDALATAVGPAAAARLEDMHRERSVDVVTGAHARRADRSGDRVEVTFDDGSVRSADVVFSSIGSAPNVEWLEESGLDVTDGVRADAFCAVAPGIWAAGDVARWEHPGLGRATRWEFRTHAAEQGVAVARNILGAATPFSPIPFRWTDQFGQRVQFAGYATPDAVEEVVRTGDDPVREVRTYSVGERLVGVIGWNAAAAVSRHRALLAPYPA